MTIRPLGDTAFILRDLDGQPADQVASAIRARTWPGVLDVNSAFETVGVYVDPGKVTAADLASMIEELEIGERPESKRHVLPCCYELGQDLAGVANLVNLRPEDIVDLHSGKDYRCLAIGFSPGFAYLGPTPEALWSISRHASPRPVVPAGSVAIAGKQTAVYPSATPGGWQIIGRCPLCLVDVDDDYFPISAGDVVCFEAISEAEFEARKGDRL